MGWRFAIGLTAAILAVVGGALLYAARAHPQYRKTETLLRHDLSQSDDPVTAVACTPHLRLVSTPATYHLRCAVDWHSGRHFVSRVTLITYSGSSRPTKIRTRYTTPYPGFVRNTGSSSSHIEVEQDPETHQITIQIGG